VVIKVKEQYCKIDKLFNQLCSKMEPSTALLITGKGQPLRQHTL